METLVIKIDGKSSKSKNIIAFLRDLAKTNKEISIIEPVHGLIANGIDSGLKDVKDILSGKKKTKTLEQFLDES